MDEHLEKIEKFWEKEVRECVEEKLKRDGETITAFYPCVEAEHNWYNGVEGMIALAERQKLGYTVELKKKGRITRTVLASTYLNELMKELQEKSGKVNR